MACATKPRASLVGAPSVQPHQRFRRVSALPALLAAGFVTTAVAQSDSNEFFDIPVNSIDGTPLQLAKLAQTGRLFLIVNVAYVARHGALR